MICIGKSLFSRSSNEVRYFNRINKFMHGNQEQYLSGKQLRKVFRLYRKWIGCARYRSLALERHVLHYITERAFWSDMEDSDFVVDLMLCMHHVEHHFGCFLCPKSDCYPKWNCYPVNISCELRVRFASFFLHHANRKQLTVGEKRIMNVLLRFRSGMRHPCEIAVTCGCSDLLLVLLQYGALTTDPEPTMYSLISMGNVLKTLTHAIRLLLDLVLHYSRKYESFEDHPKYQCMVHCGRIVVRVCPQLEKSHLFSDAVRFREFPRPEDAFKWVVQNALPQLEHRLFQPLPLKHACKLKIRKVLFSSWKLPAGIESLPLPKSLKMYLNLYSD